MHNNVKVILFYESAEEEFLEKCITLRTVLFISFRGGLLRFFSSSRGFARGKKKIQGNEKMHKGKK